MQRHPVIDPRLQATDNAYESQAGFLLDYKKADATTKIQFLKVYVIGNRVRPNPTHLIAHNTVLSKGAFSNTM